ncbi:MAG: FAD-dependent oxidoreductase, partial [Nannocystaceae bacterium]
WHPFLVEETARVERWAMVAYRRFAELANRYPSSGVRMTRVREFFGDAMPPSWLERIQGREVLNDADLPPGRSTGRGFEAPVIEMPVYLPWLERQLERAGCVFRDREIETLDEALDAAPYVVNATGLGAAALTRDQTLRPMRGQVLRLDAAPHADDRSVILDGGDPSGPLYIVPRDRDVVIGATAEPSDDMAVRDAETTSLLRRAHALSPGLTAASVESVAVGLRPWRPTIRLEHEARMRGSIFHCYGHGGAGVTLSWGCAEALVELVKTVTALTASRADHDAMQAPPPSSSA